MRWLDLASKQLARVVKMSYRIVAKSLDIYTEARRGVGGRANRFPRPQRRWRNLVLCLVDIWPRPSYRVFRALQLDYHEEYSPVQN